MSTENESRQEGAANEENQNVSRDGGYKSYNRDSNYNRYNNDGEQRPYRPRTNSYNREGGDRPYRSSYNNGDRPSYNRYNNNGDRPQRPRFNPNSEDGGEQRSYRPRTNYNREGGEQRPYTPRPRFNSGEGGEQRSYTPRPRTGGYNQGGDRPYRPRTGGYQGGGYNRPYRPRTADYNPNAKYSLKKQIEYKDILTDPNEPIRLNKFLANAGICSRREADEFITAGVVSVNGEVVTELGTKIKRTDEVKFHDEPVSIERKTYILLNKPKDCVTTSDDPQERKTVMDFVKGACKERIYPVGRWIVILPVYYC